MSNTAPAPVRKSGTIQSGEIALSYSTLIPEKSKATLILVHGINDHKGRYPHLQEKLASSGYTLCTYDLRGFGRSEGKRTDVAHYQDHLLDLKTVIDSIREENEKKKIIVIGHSLGGAIAATYCITYPNDVDGLVLSSPAYDVPRLPLLLEGVVYFLNLIIPACSLRYTATRRKRSRDPAVDSSVALDPLIFNTGTPRFYIEFRKMNRYLRERADEIVLPTLILQGGADAIIRPDGVRALYKRIKHPKKKLIWYEGFYHEVFHEIDHKRVINDMIAWMNALLGESYTEEFPS